MAGVALVNPKYSFTDALGAPLVGGTLDVYLAGTTTRTNTWQDKAQTTLNTNPIVLDSRGECTLWADDTLTYKFVLKNSAGVQQWSEDNISGQVVSATLVTFTQAGTGAEQRTAQNKMRDVLSVLDFIPESEHAAIKAGTSTYDCYASIVEAIDSVTIAASGDVYVKAGPAIFFPPGIYKCNSTIHLKKQVKLYGTVAGQPDGQPVRLVFPADTAGIVCHAYNTYEGGTEATPRTMAGDGSIIEGITLRGGGGTSATAHGIWMRGRLNVRNVTVSGFAGNGVNIVATAGGGGFTEGNANLFRLDQMRIASNGKNGLYVDGGDANAGNVIGVDCTSNAEWGIWDSSFLGNTYTGCHVDGSGLGAYKSDGPGARNVFVGCYSESGQPASEILTPALVIGGLHGAGFTAGTTGLLLYENGLLRVPVGSSSIRTTGKFTQVDVTGGIGVNTESPGETNVWGNYRVIDQKGGATDAGGVLIQRTSNNATEGHVRTDGGVNARIAIGTSTAGKAEIFTSNTVRLTVGSTTGHVEPGADNTQNLGSASLRMKEIFAGTGAINTSDARLKEQVRELSKAERTVAKKAKDLLRAFKFRDAVAEKGAGARIHFGIVAQELEDAFSSEGLSAREYGVLCYDEWDERPEVVVEREDEETGEVVREVTQTYMAAGNRYGVRYEELLAFVLAAL